MTKHTILLVYGGESSEHEVSINSALNVYAALDDQKYNVELCYIDKSGRWWLVENVGSSHVGRPQLVPALGQKQFLTLPEKHSIKPDVILPILHGKNGEDGTVQGVAQMLHIPYAGPSLLSAAITMDKDITKKLLLQAGIPVVPWLVWYTADAKPKFDEFKRQLGLPMFVKPANAGSSVGVSKVSQESDWKKALELAAEHDNKVIVEAGIDAREIELSVLGNDDPKVSGAGEIVPGEDFYSYDDKYAAYSKSKVKIPADLPKQMVEKLQRYAIDGYRATAGAGMARIDFFIDRKTGDIYLNELNSIPGFTNISMYPKLWHEAGISYSKLIDKLIELALEPRV